MSRSSLCMQRPWEHLQVTLFQILHTKSEEIKMFGSSRKPKVSRFLWQTFPLCFSKLRIMEVPFPSLSASLSLISNAVHTWNERQNLKVMEKHIQLTQRGTASSTCCCFFHMFYLLSAGWLTTFFCQLFIFCFLCVQSKSLMLMGLFQVQ